MMEHVIRCDGTGCAAQIWGQRPAARLKGWKCDTRFGLDFCPDHAASGRFQTKDRGACAFCGKDSAVLQGGTPHAHKIPGMDVDCPGNHQQVTRGT